MAKQLHSAVKAAVSNKGGKLVIVIDHGDKLYAKTSRLDKKSGKTVESAKGVVAAIGSRFGGVQIPGTNLILSLYVGQDDGTSAPASAGFEMED